MAPEPDEHFPPSWDGAVNVLRAVQWAGKTSNWDPADREACCPVCERTEAVDCRGIGGVHEPSCALALEAGLPIASADELRAEHAARKAAAEQAKREAEADRLARLAATRKAREERKRLALRWAEEPLPQEVRVLLRNFADEVS